MKRFALGTLVLVLALPAVFFAQGSGGRTTPSPVGGVTDATSGPNPYLVTRSLTGKIAEINSEKHLIVIEDKSGKRLEFKLEDKTRFKADKKTEYADKKNLSLGDFELGQPVKITYLASNNVVTELRLRREKR